MSGAVELRSGEARARIARHGGELVQWTCGGMEMLWRPDAAIWDRTSPLLFPVVGWCRDTTVRDGGKSYPMGVHGFAMHCEFEVAAQGEDYVTLRLAANAITRTHYPFDFTFDVSYRLAPDSIGVELCVENSGEREMPFACGVHPGFRWPLSGERERHAIAFSATEHAEVPVIAPGGLFSEDHRRVDFDGRRLALSDAVFAQEALCFLNARSRSLDLVTGDGGRLRAEFEEFAHLALWSRPGAPFVCIEAWTGHGDRVGFAGELRDKPSMILLPPQRQSRHAARFSWSPAAATS